MDKLKTTKSFKSLEVIWNRNTSTHKPKLLPELKGINIEDSVEKVKKPAKSPDDKINQNKIEHVHKRVRRSLFQENKIRKAYKHSGREELNKKLCESFDWANSLKKRTYSLYKASQLNCPTKSPQIISNRKNIIRNQDASSPKSKRCLYQTQSATTAFSPSHTVHDAPVVKPSCTAVRRNSRTKVFGYSKSPEIMSNRKQYGAMYNNNLDEINVSSCCDNKLNMNDKCLLPIQTPEKLNENTHTSEMQSKLNSVHSEDIIQSSDKIIFPSKKKNKNKKNIRIHYKKTKIKNCTNGSKVPECITFSNEGNEIDLPKNKINFDSPDVTNTKHSMWKSSVTETKAELEPELTTINDDNQRYHSENYLTQSSSNTNEFAKKTVKRHSKIFEPHRPRLLGQNEDNNMLSFIHSSEIKVIPATPEHGAINVDNSTVQYSPDIHSPYVPLIEVDQSPKTPHGKNFQVHIQSVQTPPNIGGKTLPVLFEPIASPTQSFVNYELPFKIDSVESPRAIHENDYIIFSPKTNKRKSDNSPSSPNRFDSAKKRKKMCKDGLRGKFRDLINRKKSEACIREYEKTLSKSYKPKQGETALLNVIEAWKEFNTIVLLCNYMKSDKGVQKVLVTLDNCPINATKNCMIRIYSPWLTIKSEMTEVLLFIGIIHAEVIEVSESIARPLEHVETSTDFNGLQTNVSQNKVLWKCNCSKDAACQCLGELSAYNYLQYMISH